MRLHAGYASRQAGAMSLPAESVAAASNAWFWVSDDAVTVETSGPILRRAGFLPYGQELTFDVPLG
jgi:hypothetical protein